MRRRWFASSAHGHAAASAALAAAFWVLGAAPAVAQSPTPSARGDPMLLPALEVTVAEPGEALRVGDKLQAEIKTELDARELALPPEPTEASASPVPRTFLDTGWEVRVGQPADGALPLTLVPLK